MKPLKFQVSPVGPRKQRSTSCKPLSILALLFVVVLIGRAFVVTHAKLKSSARNALITSSIKCEEQCKPSGTETLPKGIVSSTTDLEMRPLWGYIEKKSNMNLLAMAVGKKQKEIVDRIVRKFLVSNFVVMLFHYDGNVNDWRDLEWSAHALHVAAANQTKWWYAKRFLHPDIVAEYSYIFLWDEDLGVENFNVQSYLSVIKKEGLEISQPAIDQSDFHYLLMARQKGVVVHRRVVGGHINRRKCDLNSMEPPCAGWVEMMAPVFSRAAWRCSWYMVQNDLVHAWGMDYKFGYCAQGDRTQNIGIVDSDYVVHYAFPTLGDPAGNKTDAVASQRLNSTSPQGSLQRASVKSRKLNDRSKIRYQSAKDLETFKNRWKKAVEDDDCWTDPFQQPKKT